MSYRILRTYTREVNNIKKEELPLLRVIEWSTTATTSSCTENQCRRTWLSHEFVLTGNQIIQRKIMQHK